MHRIGCHRIPVALLEHGDGLREAAIPVKRDSQGVQVHLLAGLHLDGLLDQLQGASRVAAAEWAGRESPGSGIEARRGTRRRVGLRMVWRTAAIFPAGPFQRSIFPCAISR